MIDDEERGTGRIVDVTPDDSFVAQFYGETHHQDFEAEVCMDVISSTDRALVRVGASFDWSMTTSGMSIALNQEEPFSQEEIERAEKWAREMMRLLDGEMPEGEHIDTEKCD